MSKKSRSRTKAKKAEPTTPVSGIVVAAMVLLSGVAGLVYQVLWMKQLGLLFGNTAQAASATLAAFFMGLGLGSWWWGRKVASIARPLRLYAWLEWGIAGSAIFFLILLWGFEAIYPPVYRALSGSDWMLVVKLLLALVIVFPASFFMGGTIPIIGQVMVHKRERFGPTAAWLYALNTLGAAIGVWAAAFILMPNLGFLITYVMTIVLSGIVGGIAWKYSIKETPLDAEARELPPSNKNDAESEAPSIGVRAALFGICFFSGFVVLALEVVWTRIFAQVHENSVYAFAIVLIVVLVGLAIGAGISSLVARFVQRPMLALAVMATAGGGFLVFGPSLIMQGTDNLQPFQTNEPWGEYVSRSFSMVVGGVGFIVIALGTVFPFLMKIAERGLKMPGRMLGRLLAINTAGAIAGALLCGFYFLPNWGMWGTLKILTATYLVVALLIPSGWKHEAIVCRVAGIGALALLFTALDPSGLPKIGFPKGKEPTRILEVWEESDATVAVVERESEIQMPYGPTIVKTRSIIVNSGYSLGSTARTAVTEQVYQSQIPLYLFPETESICFIGMGTGISAGAALGDEFPNVKNVVTCELSPAVVEAAQKWIPEKYLGGSPNEDQTEFYGGLFDDDRSKILVEDGRHYLMATDQKFDMINADLFLPYRRGTGSLYSLDHYEVVAERLNPGGVFVQWLPLYQLTEYEFGVIAKTMLEVFDDVTMWRNNFYPGQEKVALICRLEPSPLPVINIDDRQEMANAVRGLRPTQTTPDMVRLDPASLPFFYAGNISQAAALFEDYPVNTDDKPVIEYQTPKLFREVAAKDEVIWCVGPKLTAWIDRIFEACPIDNDPLWKNHPVSTTHLVKAGEAFHKAMIAKALKQPEELDEQWEKFISNWRDAATK